MDKKYPSTVETGRLWGHLARTFGHLEKRESSALVASHQRASSTQQVGAALEADTKPPENGEIDNSRAEQCGVQRTTF